MTIEEFVEKCKRRSLPSNQMARVKVLARELADGAAHGMWLVNIQLANTHTVARLEEELNLIYRTDEDLSYKTFQEIISVVQVINSSYKRNEQTSELIPLEVYLIARWQLNYPSFTLLETLGYLQTNGQLRILEKAFNLLSESDMASIFISYRRSESSAFALLMENKLTQTNLSPFLDKQLQAGDDWHAELEEKIAASDYFLLILGNKTLESDITVKEIAWALEYKKTLIPIWHNGFIFNAEDWPMLPDEISQALAITHTIRVIEENPLTYDTALRELLNRFGIGG